MWWKVPQSHTRPGPLRVRWPSASWPFLTFSNHPPRSPLILQVEAGNRGPREDRTCRGMRWNPPSLLPPPLSRTTCHLPITPQPFTPGQDPGCPVAHPAPKPQTPSLSSKSSVLAKESSQPEVAPSGRQHLSSSLSSLLSENFLHPVPVLSPAVPPQHKGDGPPSVRGSVL